MNDAQLAMADYVGDRLSGWVGDRVLAAEDDREDTARRDFGDPLPDRVLGYLAHTRRAHCVAVVDDAQLVERRHLEVQVVKRVGPVGCADRPWAEPGARAP